MDAWPLIYAFIARFIHVQQAEDGNTQQLGRSFRVGLQSSSIDQSRRRLLSNLDRFLPRNPLRDFGEVDLLPPGEGGGEGDLALTMTSRSISAVISLACSFVLVIPSWTT